MPKKGDIAICHQGFLGVITKEPPIKVTTGKVVNDKVVGQTTDDVWEGIHLSPDRLGKPWLSKKPKVVGNIFDLLGDLQNANS